MKKSMKNYIIVGYILFFVALLILILVVSIGKRNKDNGNVYVDNQDGDYHSETKVDEDKQGVTGIEGLLDANTPDLEDNTITEKIEENNAELIALMNEYDAIELMHLTNDVVNFAIFGADTRVGDNGRSDVTMVMQIDPVNELMTLVSVPRDTRVLIPGIGLDKINHAYAFGGVDLSVKTLEELFDLKIDHYLKFDFESFVGIVDAFGGVEVEVTRDIGYDNEIIIPEGEDYLNGNEALVFVRFRGDGEGDIGRIKRQQKVVEAMRLKFADYETEDGVDLLAKIFSQNIKTNMSLSDILKYYKLTNILEEPSYRSMIVETKSDRIDGIWYEIYDEESFEGLKQSLGDGVDMTSSEEVK